MRISMDETRVEYLLGKRSDQLVRGLTTKTPSAPSALRGLKSRRSISTHVFQTKPLSFDFLQIVDLTAVAELGRQHSLEWKQTKIQP